MRSLILAAIAMATAVTAHAEGTTGVIVAGSPKIKVALTEQIETWLDNRGHKLAPNPLDADGIRTLANCLELQDLSCARAVVDARARTDVVVYAQGDVTREHTVVLSMYWIHKGHEPVSERRACEDCNTDTMRGTIDGILTALSRSSPSEQGRIKLASQPSGLTVVLDNETIGVTPLERDLAAGRHRIVLVQGTHQVGDRTLTVHASETAEILVRAHPELLESSHPRLPAELALGAGGTAMLVGIILVAHTDDGAHPMYRDTQPFGVGLLLTGAAAAGLGTYLWLRHGSDGAPIAAVSTKGGLIGWARAF